MQVARLLEEGPTGTFSRKLRQVRVALALERQARQERDPVALPHARALCGQSRGACARPASPGSARSRGGCPQPRRPCSSPCHSRPKTRRPDRAPEVARTARDRVLVRAAAAGALDQEEAAAARGERVPTARRPFPGAGTSSRRPPGRGGAGRRRDRDDARCWAAGAARGAGGRVGAERRPRDQRCPDRRRSPDRRNPGAGRRCRPARPKPRRLHRHEPGGATGTSYCHRDAWAIGFDGAYVIGVWFGRPDGASVPGALGMEAAAPALFDAFARLSPEPAPLPPPPPSPSRPPSYPHHSNGSTLAARQTWPVTRKSPSRRPAPTSTSESAVAQASRSRSASVPRPSAGSSTARQFQSTRSRARRIGAQIASGSSISQ